MDVIEKLREVCAKLDASIYSGSVGDEDWETVDDILDAYKPEGYTLETVETSFVNGGRWHNVVTAVHKIEQDGEVAYFDLYRDVPATEMQDCGDFSFGIIEVVPREVTVTKYVAKEAT